MIRVRPFGRAGFVCALPILALLVPQAAFATTSPAGPAQPATAAAAGTRNVSYQGVRVSVPASARSQKFMASRSAPIASWQKFTATDCR